MNQTSRQNDGILVQRETTVSLACPSIGCGGTIALKHRAGLPARQTHQVRLAASPGEPLVGEGVAELVRVEAGQVSLPATAIEHLHQAPLGQPALVAQPSPLQGNILVASRARG